MSYLTAAVRFATTAAMLAITITASVGIMRGAWRVPMQDHIRLVRWIAVCVLTAGLFGHQLYWWLWEMSVVADAPAVKQALEAHAIYVMAPTYTLILAGSGMMLSGWTSDQWGEHWVLATLGIVTVLLALGFVTALGARA